jgi:hypothetical protein
VFVAATALPPSARSVFLDQTCGDDRTLRAEVESLLMHHQSRTILAATGDTVPQASVTDTGQIAPHRLDASLGGGRAFTAALGARGQVALGALVATLALAMVGWWVHAGTRSALRQMLADKMTALLDADVAAVEHWIDGELARVESWARDSELRREVAGLLSVDTLSPTAREMLLASPHRQGIRSRLIALAGSGVKFAIWDRSLVTVADWSPEGDGVAQGVTPTGGRLLAQVFDERTVLRMPHMGEPMTKGYRAETGRPVISVLTPIRDLTGERVIAALMVRGMDAESSLNAILSHPRTGKSGEAYAFDRRGMMLTESRFNEQLAAAGLITDSPDAHSAAIVELRDPGGDLTRGFRPTRPRAACSLTEMALHAVTGEDGLNVDGYRDYRGVTVIGAWKWLASHEFGVATEDDYDEAYAPLRYLDIAFGIGLALLAVAMGVILRSWLSIAALRREVSATRRLGQYTLEELIGEGGMAQVFRARHSMLKRPTAIKLLKPGQATNAMVERFEREVQLASQLTHPNTIEIYDYGRTPDGTFYYAMEYLPGLTLNELVQLDGALPWARAVNLLSQVCRSLREAHDLGLVHRDIKPQNLMVCQRGGNADVIKVLDFGLVKSVEAGDRQQLSGTFFAGTPLYMAPERLLDPALTDRRSDLYSLGAVAYFLVVGRDVFTGDSIAAIFNHALHTPPPRAAEQASQVIPPELDVLIDACLSKTPEGRPLSVVALLEALDAIASKGTWGQREARAWWDLNSTRARAAVVSNSCPMSNAAG